MKLKKRLYLVVLAFASAGSHAIAGPPAPLLQENPAASKSAPAGVLNAADAAKLLPPSVFFRGQTAPIQARNSAGVRFADGMYMFAALVDSSGYSSGVQQKYQGYLISEVPLDFDGHQLPAGAYGFGFRPDNQFAIMDLGARDVLTAHSIHDMNLRRPMPLQIIADPAGKGYHIYGGREGVTFSRSANTSPSTVRRP
jgi:hypothetical protein